MPKPKWKARPFAPFNAGWSCKGCRSEIPRMTPSWMVHRERGWEMFCKACAPDKKTAERLAEEVSRK